MKNTENASPADFIEPLNMNGLQGRMMHMKGKKGHECLVVYGHHAMLERWWGFVQALSDYGTVTMPDLPGFGGMDSFYDIGVEPTIDAYADYLASFIKLRYTRRRIIIVGVSYGFIIATRMLERYPDLVKKVDMMVSLVGFAHYEDFTFSPSRMLAYRTATRIVSMPVIAPLFKVMCLNSVVLKAIYSRTHNAKHKFALAGDDPDHYKKMMDMEIKLWNINDVRTHMATCNGFLHVNNCLGRIDLPVWHVYSKADHYFDNDVVEQHLRVIYSDYHDIPINIKAHAPSVLAGKKESAALIPTQLKKALRSIKKAS